MKKFTLASLVLTLFFAFSLSGHSQDKDAWIETFDSQTSNSYGTGTITIDGRDWTRQGAGNFSYANTKMGSPAFTINDNTPGAFIASPSLSTLGTVSFKYAYTNGSSSNMFIVQKSTDGGTIFTDLDTHTLGEGSNETYVNYSFDVNDNSASVIIKITNDDQDAHIFIEDFTVTNFGEEPPPVVGAPTFDPAGGTYYTAQTVTMATTTEGADIFYTTDGTDPDAGSTLYTTSINVDATTTFKAIAIEAEGKGQSTITTATYTIESATEVTTIAELRAQEDDKAGLYYFSGEAFLTFQQDYRNQKFIQDATAAILIDDNADVITTTYNLYDGISGIYGELTSYKGMLQFKPILDPGAASSTGNTVTPQLVTATEFVSNFEAYEAMLVRIDNLTFADAGSTFGNGQVYATTDPSSSPLDFRTSFYNVDYIGSAIPTGGRDIVGIANQRDNAYLTARNAADIMNHTPVIPLGSTGILIAGLLMAAVLVVRRGRLF